MGVLKSMRMLLKDIPAVKKVMGTFEQQLMNLRKKFPNAREKDLKSMVREQDTTKNVRSMQNSGRSKVEENKKSLIHEYEMTKNEMNKYNPKHNLDINYAEKNGPFDQLIKDVGSMKEPRPVKKPYDPSSTTKINRYGIDRGFWK